MKKMFFAVLAISTGAFCFAAPEVASNEKWDANLANKSIGELKIEYRDALHSPEFLVTGFCARPVGETLNRIPADLKTPDVSPGVVWESNQTAGGAIRFSTDSPVIILRADIKHFAGFRNNFDLYQLKDGKYVFERMFQASKEQLQTGLIDNAIYDKRKRPRAMRAFQLNLPLYNGVKSLEIGVLPGSRFGKPAPYRYDKPILFYGSSITQGAAASRPGSTYCNLLCMALDAPQHNLGFSGQAKGEIAFGRAIGKMPAAALIYDYDYNAPDAEFLARTHEPFFLAVREAQPELPVIMISRCSGFSDKRTAVVRRTYDNAVKRGDKHVYFIEGAEFFKDYGVDVCTYDLCHPNDLGFYLMYQRVLPVLKEALGVR